MNKNSLDRILSELRQPVPHELIERSLYRVQHRLESGAPSPLTPVVIHVERRPRVFRWAAVGVGVVVLALALAVPTLTRSPRGNDAIASRDDRQLVLADGSRVETSPAAVVSVSKVSDGLKIFLTEGDVRVTAAKQHGGHLYVQTKEFIVSVVGTVFSVKAGPEGSTVTVVEGEVEVRQGKMKTTLFPGQQVMVAAAGVGPAPQAAVVPPAPPKLDATVRGAITSPGTGEGIAGVTVSLCVEPDVPANYLFENQRIVFTTLAASLSVSPNRCDSAERTVTDASGRYEFRDVESGRYVVRVQKNGYVPPLDRPSVPSPPPAATRNFESWTYEGAPTVLAEAVTMEADLRPAEVNLPFVKASTITGKVRIADRNRFAEYVSVQLGTMTKANQFKSLASVNSNSSGGYRFRVPPGEYVLFSGKLDANNPALPADAVRVVVKEGEELNVDNVVYRDPAR